MAFPRHMYASGQLQQPITLATPDVTELVLGAIAMIAMYRNFVPRFFVCTLHLSVVQVVSLPRCLLPCACRNMFHRRVLPCTCRKKWSTLLNLTELCAPLGSRHEDLLRISGAPWQPSAKI